MRKLTEEQKLIRKEELRKYNAEYCKKRYNEDPEFRERRNNNSRRNRSQKKDLKDKLKQYEEKFGKL